MPRKILFLDEVHPILKESLEKDGFQCDEFYNGTREELYGLIKEYFGIVIRSRFTMDQSILERAHNLKFIARSGSGMENIDVAFAESKGIKCFNSPEGNRDAVGEQVIGMLLALWNNICSGDQEVRQGLWRREENRGLEIGGKTFGILGYGNTGNSLAKKLRGFDCRIIAHDTNKSGFSNDYSEEVNLETLQNEADILSVHIPLNTQNHYFINASFLNAFKKSIYLINTSRGTVLNTNSLVEALKSQKVLGACLDVLEYEMKSFEKLNLDEMPDAFKYLAKADNVILTPHVAGWTKESYRKLSSVLYEKINKSFQ